MIRSGPDRNTGDIYLLLFKTISRDVDWKWGSQGLHGMPDPQAVALLAILVLTLQTGFLQLLTTLLVMV